MEDVLPDIIGIEVRPETPADAPVVFDIHRKAFGSDRESRLVDRLRNQASPHVSLVALADGLVAGHIFFSPVTIEHAPSDILCMGLGPMAVLPELQSCGLGSALVAQGLSNCRKLKAAAVFVLGHPDYYPRFGFLSAAERGFSYKDNRYDPFFFVLELRNGFLADSSGVVTYDKAFESV